MSTFDDMFEGSMAMAMAMATATVYGNQQVFSLYEDLELCGFGLDTGLEDTARDTSTTHPDIPNLFTDLITFPPQETVDLLFMSNEDNTGVELCDLTSYQPLSNSPNEDDTISRVLSSSFSPVDLVSIWPTEDTLSGNTQNSHNIYHTNFTKGRKRPACEPISPNTMMGIGPQFTNDVPPKVESIASKPKRKRVQNARQRKDANVRERKRMDSLNQAFDSLKSRVPAFSCEKRLSRIETLRLATKYISFMTEILADKTPLKNNGDNSLKACASDLIDTPFSLGNLNVFENTSLCSLNIDSCDSGHSSS